MKIECSVVTLLFQGFRAQRDVKVISSFLTTALWIAIAFPVLSQTSNLAYYDRDRSLVLRPDAKGNRLPDFSHVGYKNGESPIPAVKVVRTISPVQGDNLKNIQDAVDEVSAMKPDAKGIRGAVLLKAGQYPVHGTIIIKSSGVVLMGEGSDPKGTLIIATLRKSHNLIQVMGEGSAAAVISSAKRIVDDYIPIGAVTVRVEPGHSFKKGDRVFFQRKPNQKWIELLGMHDLEKTDPSDRNWTPTGYTVNYKRSIVDVGGDMITLDAPIVDPVESEYAEGYIIKYTWHDRIENVGIENLRLISEFADKNDEEHGWNAIRIDNAEHGWVRNIAAYHFGYSAVNIGRGASNISVLDSRCIDPVSQTTGGRKYSFNVEGQRNLIMHCTTRGGRHDFVTGSGVAGPNAFVYCTAEDQKSNIGPHHRWATGLLFDNIIGDGEMDVENRRNSGSGHGWSGSQILFWNCTAKSIILQDPPGEHINWAIGSKARVTGKGHWLEYPLGIVESTGSFVKPESIYEAQLANRLGSKKKVPAAPSKLTAKAVSGSQVDLTWKDKSLDETAFIVQMSSDNGKTWNTAAVVSANIVRCSIWELKEETNHVFRIASRNAFGCSAFSKSISVKTPKNALAASVKPDR